MEILKTILKGIAKVVWKAFLIILWGSCKLLESILQQISNLLKDAVK